MFNLLVPSNVSIIDISITIFQAVSNYIIGKSLIILKDKLIGSISDTDSIVGSYELGKNQKYAVLVSIKILDAIEENLREGNIKQSIHLIEEHFPTEE